MKSQQNIEELSEGHLIPTASKVAWDRKLIPPDWLESVDVKQDKTWHNNSSTFVFVLPKVEELTDMRMRFLFNFLGYCHPDHFSTRQVYGMTVVKISAKWWTETFGIN